MVRIGKIVATHGLTGTVIMTHILDNAKWMKTGDVLQVEMQKGSYIPFFVEKCKPVAPGEYHADLEDIKTQVEAKKLVTKHVYVNEEVIAKHAGKTPLLWIGFEVTDTTYGKLGILEDVMQTGNQWLGRIIYKEKEVLIPLIEQIIANINLKTKKLETDLPEGLIEIYLES